ncbi:MAG: ROK family protein, partial [Anaerolineales bacterium]|nr:ROK family protein [Anaerolineales bacterium]
ATPERITTELVHQVLQAGDEAVQRLINEAGHYLSIAIANIIGLLDVGHIVVAGSMARFGNALLEPIQTRLQQRALASLVKKSEVSISHLGQDIVVQGAAAILLSQELGLV